MKTVFQAILILVATPLSAATPWPDRHGPSLDGVVPPEHAEGLPVRWSGVEQAAWRAPLHDEGHASPVIGDGKVWLTAATPNGKRQFVIGVDERTGRVVHDVLLLENETVEPLGGAQGYNNYAAPSCVLAPGAVFAHFGSYGTARLDSRTARVVWRRRDLPCRHYRGPGSSPVLYQDRLILTFDGVDQQYTVALDARTGATLWRTDRSTDFGDLDENGQPIREGDLRKAYCTPMVAEIDDRVQVLSVGSRAMHSYDLATGRELWTVRHDGYNAAIRPLWLPQERLVVINTGSRRARLIAVRMDAATRGDVTDSHVVWIRSRGNPRFAKPVYWRGLIFQITDTGILYCIQAATGREVWRGRAPGDYRSSPILANGLLYFFSEQGRCTVVRAAPRYEVVAENVAPELGTTACPAVSQGALFVRGQTHLYKIER